VTAAAGTDRAPLTDRGRRTRESLLAAAREVFEKQGYGSTRMGDIAAAAGVSHGTVYTYFDTKESVLAAVVQQVIDDLMASLAASTAVDRSAGPDPRCQRPLPRRLRPARRAAAGGRGSRLHR
jgi:AcrR family transcriptional regulator